jgi:dipeptidyl aminopeptidase/acylaminoacyl peptidase
MRAYQEDVAPNNRVKRISKPMFIIGGRNDPRVPISEGDQIGNALKANGVSSIKSSGF